MSSSVTTLILLPLPEPIRKVYVDALSGAFPDVAFHMVDHVDKAVEQAPTADILISFGVQLVDEVFRRASRLKWVQALGSGVDGIMDQPSLPPHVLVTSLHGVHGAPCAEAALGAMFALARNVPRNVRNQLEKRWDRFPTRLLQGKTVCLVGIGVIAEALATRCRALGLRVTGVTSARRAIPDIDHLYPREDLHRAVSEADFIVVLAPFTEANRHLISKSVLEAMKPSAMLINIARGGVVDEQALIAHLEAGRISAAALDVFATEPLPAASPLWAMDNVLITPHLAGLHDEYPAMAIPVLIHNLQCYLSGNIDAMKNIIRKPEAGRSAEL